MLQTDIIQTQKQCTKCLRYKPFDCFSKHIRIKGGLDQRCKDCVRIINKITSYLHKIAPPKPKICDCCGRVRKLVLDHDHVIQKTALEHSIEWLDTLEGKMWFYEMVPKAFRGWLCTPCNIGFGKFDDNVEGLERALRYLKQTRSILTNKNTKDKVTHYD